LIRQINCGCDTVKPYGRKNRETVERWREKVDRGNVTFNDITLTDPAGTVGTAHIIKRGVGTFHHGQTLLLIGVGDQCNGPPQGYFSFVPPSAGCSGGASFEIHLARDTTHAM